MKKKAYLQPEIKVVEIEVADIIATSGDAAKFQPYGYNEKYFNGGWGGE